MKIVFCGGGTAGHITPNLALIDKLDAQMYYFGTNGMEKNIVKPYVERGKIAQFVEISAHKFRRKFTLSNLLLPFQLIADISKAKKQLKDVAPTLVFSKGGYAALPVVIAASQLKIPIIVHESDQTVGLANKISAKLATEFLTAYPTKIPSKVVGAIIKEDVFGGNRQKGLTEMGFDGRKPVLTVIGGSLGATALNNAILQNKSLSDRFDIFVITGKGKQIHCDFVHQTPFTNNIFDILAATDICLSRAGSNTLAELTLANVPFVCVPLKSQSRGEQIKNAQWYAQQGCCLCLDEQNLPVRVVNALSRAIDNRANIICQQRKVAKQIYGTDRVVEIINNYR